MDHSALYYNFFEVPFIKSLEIIGGHGFFKGGRGGGFEFFNKPSGA